MLSVQQVTAPSNLCRKGVLINVNPQSHVEPFFVGIIFFRRALRTSMVSWADAESADESEALLTAEAVEAYFDAKLTHRMADGPIAGATVAVVQEGELLFAKGYGYADWQRSDRSWLKRRFSSRARSASSSHGLRRCSWRSRASLTSMPMSMTISTQPHEIRVSHLNYHMDKGSTT